MPNAKSYKSRIEAFLEDLDASSKRPTLQDLYNMKPSYAVDFEDASYEQEYQGALKKVMNAFKNDQMLEFINALKHEGKLPTSRRGITEVLLDKSWGWATPHKAKKLARQRVEHVLKGYKTIITIILTDLYTRDPYNSSVTPGPLISRSVCIYLGRSVA